MEMGIRFGEMLHPIRWNTNFGIPMAPDSIGLGSKVSSVRKVNRKKGYRGGFENIAHKHLMPCFRDVVKNSKDLSSCRQGAQDCIDSHLNNNAAKLAISEEGWWHNDGDFPYDYLYAE